LTDSKEFSTKYDDVEKSTHNEKINKTVEFTSVVDAKIEEPEKVSDETDFSHLDFGLPIDYSNTSKIRDIEGFEKRVNELFLNPETKHFIDDKPWISVKGVPPVAKIGDSIEIEFSKEVKNIEVNIGNWIEYKREDKYNPKSKNVISMRPSLIQKDNNKKSIKVKLGETGYIHQKPMERWEKGTYLVDIVCTGEEEGEQTQYTRIMKLHG
jgi:hypothetical protein